MRRLMKDDDKPMALCVQEMKDKFASKNVFRSGSVNKSAVTSPGVSSDPYNECTLTPRMSLDNKSFNSPRSRLSLARADPPIPAPKPSYSPVTSTRPATAPPGSDSWWGSLRPLLIEDDESLYDSETTKDDENPMALCVQEMTKKSSSTNVYRSLSRYRPVTSPGVSSAPHNECTLTPRMSLDNISFNTPRSRLSLVRAGPPIPAPKPSTTPVTSTRPATAPPETDKVPEICLSNVWNDCMLGVCCPNMHYYLPYRWQIYKGTDWEDISDMEEIEKSYCDPKVDRVPSIDFVTMRSGDHHVRRLSTVSSVMKPPEYVLTTEWLWYWKDENGDWIQYGQPNVSTTASSPILETVYLTNPTTVLPFITFTQRYEMNFLEMKQKNVVYETEREVRRRPRYQSSEDVKSLRGSTKSSAAVFPLKTDIYPRTWDTSALPDLGCQKVLIPVTSSEFSEIVRSFTKTVSGQLVKKLWRLQNPSLWQLFQWQKEQMKKENQGQDVNELRLFHGTDTRHIDAICNQNFDWRLCGTNGTVYGQGSYFARDASYSHRYSTPEFSGTRSMFVARVLVGDYVTGNSNVKRPPLRPGSTTRYYDSCVDNVTNPSIFVVFEKHQIYPEYLLEYEKQAMDTFTRPLIGVDLSDLGL